VAAGKNNAPHGGLMVIYYGSNRKTNHLEQTNENQHFAAILCDLLGIVISDSFKG